MRPSTSLSALLAVAVAACAGEEPPKMPLGHPPVQEQGGTGQTITGEARVALDSANALFRARSYDQALAQYRRTAQLAPREVAPLLGVVMVAEATNNTRLRDSTLAQIRTIDPTLADSTAAVGHSQMIDLHSRTAGGGPRAK